MKQTAKEIGIEGRILNLSSIAHVYTYEEGIQFDNINDEDGYSDKKAYGQSKLANILHTNDLSHRLQRGNLAVARFINKIREAQIAKPCLRQPSSSKPSNDFSSLSAFDNVRVTTTTTLTSHKSLSFLFVFISLFQETSSHSKIVVEFLRMNPSFLFILAKIKTVTTTWLLVGGGWRI
ncbi:hypothetical protein JHK87_024179 [Glycine soja]|nr:hypothetical protein JHK87_024179 [Glycine soja]